MEHIHRTGQLGMATIQTNHTITAVKHYLMGTILMIMSHKGMRLPAIAKLFDVHIVVCAIVQTF